MKLLSIALVVLVASLPSFACSAQVAGDTWQKSTQEPKECYLFRNGVQIGGFRYTDDMNGEYRDYDAKKEVWSPPVNCSRLDVSRMVGKGFAQANNNPTNIDVTDQKKNYGVEWSKVDGPHTTYQGVEITPAKAIEMIQAEIPDFKKKLRCTVIGTEAECNSVMSEASKIEPAVSDRIIWRYVRPGDWSVKDLATGKQVYPDGNPSICCQAPDGKMLHRQADPVGVAEAVRKAVKKYDAEKDIDLRRPFSPLTPGSQSPLPVAMLGMAGLAALTIFTRKK